MKNILKTMSVFTLASCLTTLHSASSWAQVSTELQTQKTKVKRVNELATPSIIVAPQSGFVADFEYQRTQGEWSVDQKKTSFSTQKLDNRLESDKYTGTLAVALHPQIYLGTRYSYTDAQQSRQDTNEFNRKIDKSIMNVGSEDPNFFAGYRYNLSGISLLGELNYEMDTGKSEYDETKSNTFEADQKSGGSSVTPKLSVFTNSKRDLLFGSAFSYTFKQERKVTVKRGYLPIDSTVSGGDEMALAVIMETPQIGHSIGGGIVYQRTDSATEERSQGFLRDKVESDSYETLAASLYGNIKIGSMISILPQVTYGQYLNGSLGTKNETITSQNIWNGGLSFRMKL